MPTPPPRAQVLIVEDEVEHADVMADALKKFGHVCTLVHDVPGALEELRHGSFDVIVTDLRMPASAGANTPTGPVGDGGADAGMKVLEAARQAQPTAETIMVTAHGDVPTARAAFKLGAYDFIEKPLDLEVFRALVNRAAETVLLRHAAKSPDGGLNDLVQHDGFEGIIAGSEAMRKIIDTVRAVGPSNLPVLVTGESGTGKELIAQAIHRNSLRKTKKFVAFNCAGQAESLLEDQLFGHVKGAFTGAERDREGVFAFADAGTLFLDEIGDMPMTMQAKLLRVLESGEVVRLGSNEAKHVDVRFVSATNKDLKQSVQQGRFREDLLFRIRGAEIHLPPLRERRDDIPRIVRHAVAKFAGSLGRPAPDVTDAAMMRLTAFGWPGNVRQLLNVVQNMVVMGSAGVAPDQAGTLDVRHIPEDIATPDEAGMADDDAGPAAGGTLAGSSLAALEKRAIRETLRLTAGNREHAARLLGIGERTLYRKLKEYGLR
ncbi:MAG: sigma-54-dependent Fis family transcriptional regulator [Planctomycetes bacterium]|nr:sigma-54-dependent Fis family transcriptional regulator [Planctomycetota bacterium]